LQSCLFSSFDIISDDTTSVFLMLTVSKTQQTNTWLSLFSKMRLFQIGLNLSQHFEWKIKQFASFSTQLFSSKMTISKELSQNNSCLKCRFIDILINIFWVKDYYTQDECAILLIKVMRVSCLLWELSANCFLCRVNQH